MQEFFGEGLSIVADYGCYVFGTAKPFVGVSGSFDGAENFVAETDDEARMKAETLYRQRRNQVHGFEVWQADRLVCRHQTPKADHQSKPLPNLAERRNP